MSSTANLGLDLVQPAQAQKHVTVNEAFVRIDGLAQLVLQEIDQPTPPIVAVDGQCWAVPMGATGGWQGHDGDIALWSNGGWVFVAARQGWRAWILDIGSYAIHDGTAWQLDVVAAGPFGASTRQVVEEISQVILPGPTSIISGAISAGSLVIGVTARVIADIGGTLTTWRMGTPTDNAQFGVGMGLVNGSWARGLLNAPTAFYSDTDIVLGGEGGDFASGEIRIAVHAMRLEHPAS